MNLHKSASLYIFFFYALLHGCIFTLNNYATDDYMQNVYATGSSELEAVGLLDGIKVRDFNFFVNNQFNFFDPQLGNDIAMRNYGALPWWTKEQAMLHLWRPVSSLTHWLDYQLWPQSKRMMQSQNGVWMFASFLLVSLLFKKILPSSSVFVFALLVYGLDVSMAPVVGWIAARNSLLVICFLVLTLYFFHHSFLRPKVYGLALLFFALALLSAEAGIVVAAYLGAYVLFFPVSTFQRKLLRVMPFLVAIILWRWFYHAHGFGAFNIGQYIDPVRSPMTFLEQALRQFPLLFIEMVTGVDAVEVITPVQYLDIVRVSGWLLFLVFLTVSLGYYKSQKQVAFWFFSAIFSLLPGLMTYSSDPRVVIYAHIAFSALIALIVVDVWQKYVLSPGIVTRLSLLVVSPFVLLHIFVQFVAILLMNYAVLMTNLLKPEAQYAELYGFEKLVKSNDHVVLFNHRDVFRLMYYPYIAKLENFPLPKTLRQMNTAQTAIRVKKLSEVNYAIMSEGGFIFHPNDIKSLGELQQQQSAFAGHTIKYSTFFHDGNYNFSAGQEKTLPEMDIRITEVDKNHRPMVVEMRLHKGQTYRLIYWDWPSHTYKYLPEMKVDEVFVIGGPE